jgi:hypothetical protein
LYEFLYPEPDNQTVIDQNAIVRRKQKRQMNLTQEDDEQDSEHTYQPVFEDLTAIKQRQAKPKKKPIVFY